MELATHAQKHGEKDWWWLVQIALVWLRLGQPRNAEKYFRLAIQVEPMLLSYIGLAKVYVKMDQPLAAIDICSKGLEKFPGDVGLLTEMARLVKCKMVLILESIKVSSFEFVWIILPLFVSNIP